MKISMFEFFERLLVNVYSKGINIVFLLFFFLVFGTPKHSYAQTWLPRVEKYLAESRDNPPTPGSTFFLGSSTWTQWGATLEADFVEYKAVNRGFGGSRIPDQLVYMDSLVMPYAPARVLFFCGTNDILRKSPDSVLRDFKTFLGRLWTVFPETQVYFVSVPHAPSRKKHWLKGDSLNRMVKELADEDEGLIYVDIVSDMYDDDNGNVREELYKTDRLHMNRKGQEVWIPILKKAIDDHPIVRKNKAQQKRLYKKRGLAGILQKDNS